MTKIKLILAIILLGLVLGAAALILARRSAESPEQIRAKAWNTFQEYLEGARRHDLGKLKSASFQVSDACKNSGTRDECFKRMDIVYNIAKEWRLEDFDHIIFDKKQIVLSTSWTPVENDFSSGYERRSIYFTRDLFGRPKILRFTTPTEALAVPKIGGYDAILSDMKAKIDSDLMKDADNDGWWDYIEGFFYAGNGKPSSVATGTVSTSSSSILKPFGDLLRSL